MGMLDKWREEDTDCCTTPLLPDGCIEEGTPTEQEPPEAEQTKRQKLCHDIAHVVLIVMLLLELLVLGHMTGYTMGFIAGRKAGSKGGAGDMTDMPGYVSTPVQGQMSFSLPRFGSPRLKTYDFDPANSTPETMELWVARAAKQAETAQRNLMHTFEVAGEPYLGGATYFMKINKTPFYPFAQAICDWTGVQVVGCWE